VFWREVSWSGVNFIGGMDFVPFGSDRGEIFGFVMVYYVSLIFWLSSSRFYDF